MTALPAHGEALRPREALEVATDDVLDSRQCVEVGCCRRQAELGVVAAQPARLTGVTCRRSLRAVHRFDAELWLHDGEGGWCFATVPGDVSDDVRARSAGARPGFGSVRVRVTVGATTWTTSLFPDAARGAYLLPVRKDVRVRERLEVGDRIAVDLELLGDGAVPGRG